MSEILLQLIMSQSCFVVGLQQLMELTGSFILTMALFMNRLTVSQASWLARLETEYQVS